MKIESFRKISLVIVWPAFAFITLFAAWMLKQHFSRPDFANAVLYPETSRSLEPFTLIDFNNEVFDKSRLLGKWSFVFFGYTHCPDICPLALQTLNQAARLMEQQGDNGDAQFIFISVDPQRDGNKHLKNYVTYFNPDFLGVSGGHQQLTALSRALGAPFNRIENSNNPKLSTIAHSAQIFLISPKAERYGILPQPHQARDITRDFYVIQSYYKRGAQHYALK